MKKLIALMMTVAVAGVATADISVDFKSGGVPLLLAGEVAPSPTTMLAAGSLVQLVWKSDATGYQSADLDSSLVNSGEFVLSSGAANFGGMFAFGSALYGNSDVGGADITSGAFYGRIFDSADGAVGSYFLEMGLQGPGLNTFSALDPSTSYTGNLNDIGMAAIDAQGTQVIPEPATLGLMGIAGLGMFLARKKTRA